MPAGLIAALPLIFSGAGAATALGSTIYNAENQPNLSANANSNQPTQAQAIASETANRQQATTQAQELLPGLQAQTSGGVSPGYLADMSSLLSGNSQYGQSPQIQQAVQSFLGLGGSNGSTNSLLPGLTSPSPNASISSATSNFLSPNQSTNNPFAAQGLA